MSSPDQDNTLVQDFLTESSELVEALDAGLVRLESDPTSKDLLDQAFRVLHTIKGASSFLNLPNVTRFSHAAEDALNRLRKGEVDVTQDVMDALLNSVDVIRGMLEEIREGSEVSPGPAELVDALREIAGRAAGAGGATPAARAAAKPVEPAGSGFRALELPPQAEDVLPFMNDDLRAAADRLRDAAGLIQKGDPSAGSILTEMADGLQSTREYFGLPSLAMLVTMVRQIVWALPALPEGARDRASTRLGALALLVERCAEALKNRREHLWDLGTFGANLAAELSGNETPTSSIDDPSALVDAELGAPAASTAATGSSAPAAEVGAGTDQAGSPAKAGEAGKPAAKGEREASGGDNAGDATVRVKVSRLEALMNLVGEMVLTKNQLLSQARTLRSHGLPHDLLEAINSATGSLDRLTGELQVGVMRTRVQPLAKLFGRYPRIIRDLSRATGKQIRIVIDGGETEVDKGVLEALAGPLVHILRNSADHGIEKPDVRQQKGKDPVGTIRILAEHQGGHVRVAIIDDGKGIDPAVISAKAIERGLATAEEVAAMSKQEILRFIFAAGFSTAEKVSDLSGRGVGMDVARTNIAKLGGNVSVDSVTGQGSTIEITIPLTVAILPAMLVGVGQHDYAVPIASIVEIVRCTPGTTYSVAGSPVMRLRESVLPLVNMRDTLSEHGEGQSRFTVVIGCGQQRAGLVVDRLIGRQEIVVKPLDDAYTAGGPFSGATICEDGHVSLILDVIQLIRSARAKHAAAA